MQLKEKDNSLQLDVQQEQSEAILRMQEDTETLEELVSDTVMCTYTYIVIYVTGFAKRILYTHLIFQLCLTYVCTALKFGSKTVLSLHL